MTIIDTINRSQSLIQQIKSINTDIEVHSLLSTLAKEITTLQFSVEQLQNQVSTSGEQITSAANTPETKSGCYIFAEDKNYYCPQCYDQNQMKIATTRINSKLRVCPTCRTSIK